MNTYIVTFDGYDFEYKAKNAARARYLCYLTWREVFGKPFKDFLKNPIKVRRKK